MLPDDLPNHFWVPDTVALVLVLVVVVVVVVVEVEVDYPACVVGWFAKTLFGP